MLYLGFFKRFFDFFCALFAIIGLSPVFLVLSLLGAIKMKGNPFFTQLRPGKNEKVFRLIKFRTMTNETDSQGTLLPDEKRLTKYGIFLRSTSLDELPELFNILIGKMSIVGPRPQLIRDMVFMNQQQRQRHRVLPGLTGLAQVCGRNNITWEQKFEFDLEYIQKVTLFYDIKIIFRTLGKVLARRDIVREGTASDMDLGDWLLQCEQISEEEYRAKLLEARDILNVVEGTH